MVKANKSPINTLLQPKTKQKPPLAKNFFGNRRC